MSEALAFGSDGDEDGLLRWAGRIVGARIQSYCRLSIVARTNVTATFTGNPSRRLVLGERPVTAVGSVTVVGHSTSTPTAVTDYRWTRAGILYRDVGWGDESHEITVVYSFGYATVPRDIAGVIETASLRMVANPLAWRSQTETEAGEQAASRSDVAEVPSGFTPGELAVLNRYRRRTA